MIHLSDHFTYRKLLRFTLPSIVMNIFSSLYIIADGYFVANFTGQTEFAAVNLIMPVLNILGTIGYMFGVGGSALIAKTLSSKNAFMVVASCLRSSFNPLNEAQYSTGKIFGNAKSLLIGIVFAIVRPPFDCVFGRTFAIQPKRLRYPTPESMLRPFSSASIRRSAEWCCTVFA